LAAKVAERGLGLCDLRGSERHFEAGPHPEPDHQRCDRHDGGGVDDRSHLASENFDQRRTRRRLEVVGRIDEIDNGNLDDVPALSIEAGGRRDQLFDLVDLICDRVWRRLVPERSGERSAIDQHRDREVLDREAGAGCLNRFGRDFVLRPVTSSGVPGVSAKTD
jgi:hypothetical protein